jgi:ATP-dependent DNA helicase RecQ
LSEGRAAARKGGLDSLSLEAKQLFEELRKLRKQLADEQGVPPYVVFSDKTLVELSILKPSTRDEMLTVSGIGEVKLERYAEPFLEAIREFPGG